MVVLQRPRGGKSRRDSRGGDRRGSSSRPTDACRSGTLSELKKTRSRGRAHLNPTRPSQERVGWVATFGVVLLTLLFRIPWIDGLALHGDEDISLLVSRGIVESGVPRLPSGGLYLRSPAYYYLVAPLVDTGVEWLPRLLSVFVSTFAVVIVMRLGRQLVGERAALLGGLFYAISLTEIATARTFRMYALYEFLSLILLGLLYRLWRTGTLRSGLLALAMGVATLTVHTLSATLWVLGLVVVTRDVKRQVRVFAILSTGFFAAAVSSIQALESSAIRNGGLPVSEPAVPSHLSGFLDTLRSSIAEDPLIFGRTLLGEIGFIVFALALSISGAAWAWNASRSHSVDRQLLLALAVGLTLASAGAHQIGLALTLCSVLIVLSPELFPEASHRRLLIGVIASTFLVSILWVLAAVLSGHEPLDAILAFTRWPGRLARLFLWPPAIAVLAVPGVLAVLVRSWSGRATDGERFLVLTLLLVVTSRGLLSPATHPRYVVELWPLWGLLAGWTAVNAVGWLRDHCTGGVLRRTIPVAASLLVGVSVFVLPGTNPRQTFDYLKLAPGRAAATGFGRSFSVPDISGAATWLRPKLQPGDRIVATDWLTTYCYVGRVDGWSRWQGWARQSRMRNGVVREFYLGAEVLPDLESLQRFLERGRAWFILGAGELEVAGTALHPEVRSWLLELEPAYLARDGRTRVFKFDPEAENP